MNKIKLLCLMLCLVIIAGTLVKTAFAKYVKDDTNTISITADTFYFESEQLKSAIELNCNETEVTITLSNHDDNLRFSNIDIKYSVTITDQSDSSGTPKVKYNSTSNQQNGDYYISGGEKNDVTVTLSELKSGHTYTVTATGENGYHKTLTGTITVKEN